MTAVETRVGHEWRIVAPWWHWPLLDGHPAPGPADARRAVRVSAPVLQKYDGPDLVNTFLADPQRRLDFLDDTDRVATVTAAGIGALPTRAVSGGTRKLYLASHHRHYLVVCSLHCDAAGFPHARRDDVCEAGFVVRRRKGSIPGGPGGPAARALREWAVVRRKRRAVEQRLRTAGPLRQVALERRLTALTATEDAALCAVQAHAVAARAAGPIRELHGWVPVGVDGGGAPGPMSDGGGPRIPLTGVGCWVPVEEMPAELTEATFPLTALVPDRTRPDHDATGQTLYFGVVPTGSSDVEPGGAARFDDEQEYEIRCFCRRHRPECPRESTHCSCPVTWSEPTEHYRLAGHFDLEGTANRPVTVQLPDLRQLQADALRLGPGGAGGVRFSSPPGSELAFTTDDLTASRSPSAMGNAGFQICSFAIPLITIVAFFVLQLFLPIVVFVFQLWFLLVLRFCLPPDAEVTGGLLADFEALGGGLDIDAGVAASVVARPTFRAALATLLGGSRPGGKRLDLELTNAVSRPPPDTLDTRSLAVIARGALAQVPPPDTPRPFARRVTRAEVVQP
ncbi:hypothetical protein SAMN05660464_0930 [Geodermatophilus dictyosporus]|uniref:Uncharacterized protein n=1 Tax=Geodermatophilus dictyosporus TaxID=1523247 RepID=A0A1I5JPJ8_9ACTN|nr:hypothetical protein [Geodermatophilus dictyosporus]SFO74744.1 hypothetical protein SAMN05660464_0930 [Geodermatophilus dictyosporus]